MATATVFPVLFSSGDYYYTKRWCGNYLYRKHRKRIVLFNKFLLAVFFFFFFFFKLKIWMFFLVDATNLFWKPNDRDLGLALFHGFLCVKRKVKQSYNKKKSLNFVLVFMITNFEVIAQIDVPNSHNSTSTAHSVGGRNRDVMQKSQHSCAFREPNPSCQNRFQRSLTGDTRTAVESSGSSDKFGSNSRDIRIHKTKMCKNSSLPCFFQEPLQFPLNLTLRTQFNGI